MPLLLLLAFVVVPILEIYVIVQVGQQIGAPATIALLILDSVLGAWLVRREGRRTWAAFRAALASSKVPAKEVADGALVIFGGALLLTPGFATDVLGLLCVAPPSRALLRKALTGVVASRLGVVGLAAGAAGRAAGRRRPGPHGYQEGADPSYRRPEVIDGEVIDEQDGPRPGVEERGP